MKRITVIIPFLNEESVLEKMYERLTLLADSCCDYRFDFLFVNDGSTDQSLPIILGLKAFDDRISVVDLSRNYGKEIAMLAGFDHAQGDAAVVIDSDLQQPPELIKEMIVWWEKGYEDVYAVRKERKGERFLKKWTSAFYYRILQKASKTNIYPNAGDFRLLDRKAVEALKTIREQERYTKGLYSWIGFKKKELFYNADERAGGTTKWRFSSLFHLAMNGVTSYTTLPLKITTIIGGIVSIAAFLYMMIVLVQTLLLGADVSGYPSLMIGILFLGGLQLISLGIIGEYLGRVFNETKKRPLYFIDTYYESKSPLSKKEKVEENPIISLLEEEKSIRKEQRN
ncbi:hypothetical protein UAY_02168 [Enterococcus moraviensis ATCC BAA-383]|uniref:Glycosyltransferase 2-like domain-containing protein n=1 Tax=Enterococcus moraviensis ATCC BAA-383 TaxID=1158609 RepID=R2TFG5_9ENTE|nr:glycosyltransferase family 2 protein [Enterococcus moraviensis]EOH98899.1 hypothetical protein UAY_02168 [Enterococcus moraviensis ATCC BAA-383]EOT71926.1 hypothetical protein I586_01733 [Enterococcus moraviensis ATCC BAA-383]OJG68045.1 hypothetical protein RV09_GL002156 [Enterococcus moraviensis]